VIDQKLSFLSFRAERSAAEGEIVEKNVFDYILSIVDGKL